MIEIDCMWYPHHGKTEKLSATVIYKDRQSLLVDVAIFSARPDRYHLNSDDGSNYRYTETDENGDIWLELYYKEAKEVVKAVTLESLVGRHRFSGCDYDYSLEQSSQAIRFRFGKTVYVATENPQDGLRSCLEEIRVDNQPIVNKFKPVRVQCAMDGDMLVCVDVKSKKAVLVIGTDTSDDCYPRFVASFEPRNLYYNT